MEVNDNSLIWVLKNCLFKEIHLKIVDSFVILILGPFVEVKRIESDEDVISIEISIETPLEECWFDVSKIIVLNWVRLEPKFVKELEVIRTFIKRKLIVPLWIIIPNSGNDGGVGEFLFRKLKKFYMSLFEFFIVVLLIGVCGKSMSSIVTRHDD